MKNRNQYPVVFGRNMIIRDPGGTMFVVICATCQHLTDKYKRRPLNEANAHAVLTMRDPCKEGLCGSHAR